MSINMFAELIYKFDFELVQWDLFEVVSFRFKCLKLLFIHYFRFFYVCGICGTVYWDGCHIVNYNVFVEPLLEK